MDPAGHQAKNCGRPLGPVPQRGTPLLRTGTRNNRAAHSELAVGENRVHRENALRRRCIGRGPRGPFGFAQGRLFDCALLRFCSPPCAQDDRVGEKEVLRSAQDDKFGLGGGKALGNCVCGVPPLRNKRAKMGHAHLCVQLFRRFSSQTDVSLCTALGHGVTYRGLS